MNPSLVPSTDDVFTNYLTKVGIQAVALAALVRFRYMY